MVIFRTGFGVGDVLLSTGVLRAWRRQHIERVIVETRFPGLFQNNPDVWRIWNDGRRSRFITTLFGHRGIWRVGSALNEFFDRHTLRPMYPFPCPGRHLIEGMAETVEVDLLPEERRPFLYLTDEERAAQSWAQGWIAVQSSSTSYWSLNKDWIPGRMQAVVDALRGLGYPIVHMGSAEDDPLERVKDLCGKTSLRETGAILANAQLFIGLEGGLVHLARAVDTRSVVIYTGYTQPHETGYPENINLRDPGAGDSCWRRKRCEHCRKSAENVSVDMVLRSVERILCATHSSEKVAI
jgi:ADP-heptose:LPS heptosyltransferase